MSKMFRWIDNRKKYIKNDNIYIDNRLKFQKYLFTDGHHWKNNNK